MHITTSKVDSRQPLINPSDMVDSNYETAKKASREEASEVIILYAYRFVVIFVYFYHLLLIGGMQNTFAPIQDRVIFVFNSNTTAINWLALVFPLLNVTLSSFTGFTLERRGITTTLRFSAFVVGIGAWLRYLGTAEQHLWLVMFGQAVVAAGQPFAIVASTLLSESWFSEDGRAIATAVGGLAPIIGTVVASIVGPMFFSGVSCVDHGHNHRKLTEFTFITAIMVSANVLMMFTLMRDRPPSPPSHSAFKQGERHLKHEDDLPLATMLSRALSNWNFLLLMGGFGFGYAAVNALTTLINQILHPLHYTDTEIGNIGAALGAGIIGSVIVGVITDITKRFVAIVRTCAACAAIGLAWFLYILWSDPSTPHPTLAFVSLAILGFFGIPLVPVILEMGVEITYPLTEGISTSLLWMGGNLFGMAVVLIGNAMQESCLPKNGPPDPNSCSRACNRPETAMRNATYLMGGCFGFALLCTLFFNGRFLRLESEQMYHKEHEERIEHPELYH